MLRGGRKGDNLESLVRKNADTRMRGLLRGENCYFKKKLARLRIKEKKRVVRFKC